MTSGPFWGVPMISMRSTGFGSLLPLGASSAVTVVPSSVVSTSARSTVPTAVPGGTRSADTVPRGSLAPAARHVHVVSSD